MLLFSGTQTEISAADKLYELRKEQAEFVQGSFETISASGKNSKFFAFLSFKCQTKILYFSGPNGAIIHYKPDETSNRSLNVEEMFLCDSGAQYRDGTTDITRTIHFGTPSEFEREMFTRVVKGHINLGKEIIKFNFNWKLKIIFSIIQRVAYFQSVQREAL